MAEAVQVHKFKKSLNCALEKGELCDIQNMIPWSYFKNNNVDINIIIHGFLCIYLNVELLGPRRGMCLNLADRAK